MNYQLARKCFGKKGVNNVIVYRGHYEDCVNYINKLIVENMDFDLDL